MVMTRALVLIILFAVWLSPAALEAQNSPQWMVALRDAIYEQKLTANQIVPVYNAAKAAARQNLSGAALNIALSRCEFFMGRAYLFEERNNEARINFSEGLRIADGLVQTAPGDEAWVLRAENLSHICQISSVAFVMANGLKVEEYARNALQYNGRNAKAQYLIAARWVYAPAPLNNIKKGIEMMTAIIQNGDMDRDDRFNVYSAIGYAHLQQKKNADARIWLQRSLEVYPTNKYVNGLLNGIN